MCACGDYPVVVAAVVVAAVVVAAVVVVVVAGGGGDGVRWWHRMGRCGEVVEVVVEVLCLQGGAGEAVQVDQVDYHILTSPGWQLHLHHHQLHPHPLFPPSASPSWDT